MKLVHKYSCLTFELVNSLIAAELLVEVEIMPMLDSSSKKKILQ